MDDQNIQSIETNQSYDDFLSLNDHMSLDEKVLFLQKDFESRYTETKQAQMIRKENFLRNYQLLSLLSKVKRIDIWIENCHKDRSSIEMLIDLYACQLIELDSRLEAKLAEFGEWSGEINNNFMDAGYAFFKRYFVYKLLGTYNSVASNSQAKFTYYKVLILQIFFISMIIINAILFLYSAKIPGFLFGKIRRQFILQSLYSFGALINFAFFIYAPALDFWIRNLFGKLNSYSQEIQNQITFCVAELHDLALDISALREEIAFNFKTLIESTQSFKAQSNYDTYLTFNELKVVLVNQRFISQHKQNVLFVALGINNLWHFLHDYSFVYWILRSHINKIGIFVLAIGISFTFRYSALPFLNNAQGLWKGIAGALIAEELLPMGGILNKKTPEN